LIATTRHPGQPLREIQALSLVVTVFQGIIYQPTVIRLVTGAGRLLGFFY